MKKRFCILLCFMLALSLCGCSFVSIDFENLAQSPRFTMEQTQIYDALLEATGKNINLKYPKTGDYRSAFIISDFDGNGDSEALVLYQMQSASNDSAVRATLLDETSQGIWSARYDIAGGGTDVEKVTVTESEYGSIFITVGYSSLNMDEKILHVYTVRNGGLFLVASDHYSVMETIDIDNSGYEDLIAIRKSSQSDGYEACLYEFGEKNLTYTSVTPMATDSVAYTAYIKGFLSKDVPALFVESTTTNALQSTEIIYYRNGALVNPMAGVVGGDMFAKTGRIIGYNCADIDEDTIPEIPIMKILPGYEESENPLYFTTWCNFKPNIGLVEKYAGYCSNKGSFHLTFPSRWNDRVTITYNSANDEFIFYKYEGQIKDNMTELMRIVFVSKTQTAEYIHDGYELLGEKGQTDYLLKLSEDRREPLIPTFDEIENNFYIL